MLVIHIFILHLISSRFVNTAYALAHAIKQICTTKNPEDPNKFLTSCDNLFFYDISYAYSINAVEHFCRLFLDMVSRVKEMWWLIPVVHVQNHKENCMYLYSSVYIPGAGHKQEIAKMTWAEFNQLGPQVQQMNNGHRQDTIIDHYGDWNWKKTANMCKVYLGLPFLTLTWPQLQLQLYSMRLHVRKDFLSRKEMPLKPCLRLIVIECHCGIKRICVIKRREVHCVYHQNEAKGQPLLEND